MCVQYLMSCLCTRLVRCPAAWPYKPWPAGSTSYKHAWGYTEAGDLSFLVSALSDYPGRITIWAGAGCFPTVISGGFAMRVVGSWAVWKLCVCVVWGCDSQLSREFHAARHCACFPIKTIATAPACLSEQQAARGLRCPETNQLRRGRKFTRNCHSKSDLSDPYFQKIPKSHRGCT
jgi:hypothetical protein